MLVTLATPQRTLAAPIELSGEAVFTGGSAKVRVSPADAGFGIRVQSTEHPKVPPTPTHAAHLVTHPNHSTLAAPGNPDVTVHMVEHVLSALHGMGIDNALIAVTGGECPLGDGSALPYVEAFLKVGIVAQKAARQAIRLTESKRFEEGGSSLSVEPAPADLLEIEYTLMYDHPVIGRSQIFHRVTPERYAEAIAPARTFIPIEEAERMVKAGLLRSTDATQCLVVYPSGTNHRLRVKNEFAAHKVLDLIGDLRLAGYPVLGRVKAIRSGHALNHRAAQWIAETQI